MGNRRFNASFAWKRLIMIIVDTNVLVDVLENDPTWSDWSTTQMRKQALKHTLVINPIIYAELALTFTTFEELDSTIENLQLKLLEIPRPALFLASKAFIRYRKQGGTKTNVLADFFIGAHAAVLNCTILTRDARRYANYFPTVNLLIPN